MPFAIPSPIAGQVPATATPIHRFFDHLVAAEAGLAGYMLGHMQQAGTILPQGPIRHVCFVEHAEIECDVPLLFSAIAALSWPTSIRMIASAMPQPLSTTRTTTPIGIQRLTGNLHAHAFLTYYENARHEMDARYGTDPGRWPEVLKFARMTRNAFGHGGMLDIRDPRATGAWRGLTLSHANNGEQMLYNHIASGDVVLLMLDIEDLL